MTSQRKKRQAERNWQPEKLTALNESQALLLELMSEEECVIATGPAGTGKTYLAAAEGCERVFNRVADMLIVARPTVGAGKTMGFLPGDAKRKMAPWARPVIESMSKHYSGKRIEEMQQAGQLKVESFEHIRGLTFDRSVLILDEAQNTTPQEMKAFLTRIGDDSVVRILGDMRQSDLGPNNGLAWALEAVQRGLVPKAVAMAFRPQDVVRSELCHQWGEAFDFLEDEWPHGYIPKEALH